MNLSALFTRARRAKQLSGKSLLSQGREILHLRQATGKLGPSEYYDYGLYDDSKFTVKEKEEFIGWSRELFVNHTLNKSEWAVLALDKIVFYTFLEGVGIPYPRLKAIFDPSGRFIKNTPTFTSVDVLGEYLKQDHVYPVFVKPSHGNFGRGTHLLSDYDRQTSEVIFSDKTQLPLDEFLCGLEPKLSHGQIFQEVFTPHPDLALFCGLRSSTVRVVVVVDKQGPHLLCSVWKIPTGNNIIDNFHHGRTGNLIASVDTGSGKVCRVIGKGADEEFTSVTIHPDTQQCLHSVTIPNWPEVRDLCLTAARLIPGFRLFHFDVALAEKGPQLLEMNYQGSLDLLQHASAKGVFSAQVVKALNDQEEFRQEIVGIMKKTIREQQGQSGA